MTVATTFTSAMAALTGNTGGAVQSMPNVTGAGAKECVFAGTITLANQAIGSIIGVARIPIGAQLTGIQLITDTSLGTATIALGDVNTAALYMAAQTLTTTNVPQRVGLAAAHATPITTGYDCSTGLVSKVFEDLVITTAVAALPSSGNLTFVLEYTQY